METTLFEPGAPAPDGFVPLAIPEISGNEWRYVRECLEAGWVSSVGAYTDRLEAAFAEYVGAKHAIVVTSGTAAVHVALSIAGVRPDDEVIVSTLSFIAPANAIRYLGAWPVFMDAEPQHWQMDPQKVSDFLDEGCCWRDGALYNKQSGRRVRALLPVHALGHPCDLDALLECARRYELAVIEDACESLGARYKGQRLGHHGDLACFSLNGNKIITAGGGGVILTDDEGLARRARYLTTQAKDDPVEYIHREVGYNYRLTNLQAAVAVAQMERLEEYVGRKRAIAEGYGRAFHDLPGLSLPVEATWAFSTYWMYTVLISAGAFGLDSRALLARLGDQRIQARPLWQPLHKSPAHAGSFAYRCEVAERLHQDALSLPCSVGLRPEEQRRVIAAVRAQAGVP